MKTIILLFMLLVYPSKRTTPPPSLRVKVSEKLAGPKSKKSPSNRHCWGDISQTSGVYTWYFSSREIIQKSRSHLMKRLFIFILARFQCRGHSSEDGWSTCFVFGLRRNTRKLGGLTYLDNEPMWVFLPLIIEGSYFFICQVMNLSMKLHHLP